MAELSVILQNFSVRTRADGGTNCDAQDYQKLKTP